MVAIHTYVRMYVRTGVLVHGGSTGALAYKCTVVRGYCSTGELKHKRTSVRVY